MYSSFLLFVLMPIIIKVIHVVIPIIIVIVIIIVILVCFFYNTQRKIGEMQGQVAQSIWE